MPIEMDWESGRAVVEVKSRTKAVRTVRDSLMRIAYRIESEPDIIGYLLLVEPKITDDRLEEELDKCRRILHDSIKDRLIIICTRDGELYSISSRIDEETKTELIRIAEQEIPQNSYRLKRPDYSAEILKLLILHWMINSEDAAKPIEVYTNSVKFPDEFRGRSLTSLWLGEEVGSSYYPVADALDEIGKPVLRFSDRSVTLKYFPRYAWEKMTVNSESSRFTKNYSYEGGAPLARSTESLLKRFKSLMTDNIGIGGVIGAKRFLPGLNIVGSPRLDLTVHCPEGNADLSFIRKLDPALVEQKTDEIQPSLTVHFLRRRHSFFSFGNDRTVYADPIECLLDLQEAHLDIQALQFREEIFPGEK